MITLSKSFPLSHLIFVFCRVPFVDLVNNINFISVTWEKHPMTFVGKRGIIHCFTVVKKEHSAQSIGYTTDLYPSLNNTCGNGACTITSDDSCLCNVTLSETPVFESVPSRAEVLSLKIGAFDPATFSDSDVSYSLLESSDDVEVFVSSEAGIVGDTSTIFKVVDEYGDAAFFKNMISTITLGNLYDIRNPPSFMNLAKIEQRDAEYEGVCRALSIKQKQVYILIRLMDSLNRRVNSKLMHS